MNLEALLQEDIGREHEYLTKQEVGSEEYNASLKRLASLENQLFDLKKINLESVTKNEQIDLENKKLKFEAEQKSKQIKEDKKDRLIKNTLEGVKVIVGGIIIPIVGLVCITATEKETTFCGALKDYTKLFVPKKLL